MALAVPSDCRPAEEASEVVRELLEEESGAADILGSCEASAARRNPGLEENCLFFSKKNKLTWNWSEIIVIGKIVLVVVLAVTQSGRESARRTGRVDFSSRTA